MLFVEVKADLTNFQNLISTNLSSLFTILLPEQPVLQSNDILST